jgi:hypothetical protein
VWCSSTRALLHVIALKKVQKRVSRMHQTKFGTSYMQDRERGEFGQRLATSDPEAKAWLLEQGLVVASLEIIGIVGDMVRKVAWQALNHTTLWLATLLVGAWADFSDNTRVSRLHVAICSTFVLKRTAPRLVPI